MLTIRQTECQSSFYNFRIRQFETCDDWSCRTLRTIVCLPALSPERTSTINLINVYSTNHNILHLSDIRVSYQQFLTYTSIFRESKRSDIGAQHTPSIGYRYEERGTRTMHHRTGMYRPCLSTIQIDIFNMSTIIGRYGETCFISTQHINIIHI